MRGRLKTENSQNYGKHRYFKHLKKDKKSKLRHRLRFHNQELLFANFSIIHTLTFTQDIGFNSNMKYSTRALQMITTKTAFVN